MDIKEIIRTIETEEVITPGTLADYRLKLSASYGFQASSLAEILKKKPKIWMEIRCRESVESDKMTEKLWEMTELGQEEIGLRWELKGLEKVLSAVNSRLRAYENEAKYNY